MMHARSTQEFYELSHALASSPPLTSTSFLEREEVINISLHVYTIITIK